MVAKPVTLRIRARANSATARSSPIAAVLGEPPSKTRAGEPRDPEWSKLADMAGKLQRGCLLEATLSPVGLEKLYLDVSLTCRTTKGAIDEDLRTLAKETPECRLLVRGPNGKPVRKAPGTDEGARLWHAWRDRLREGDAVYTLVPLKEWFDVSASGDYWVLVTLPGLRAGDAPWVAEPFKVTVGKK